MSTEDVNPEAVEQIADLLKEAGVAQTNKDEGFIGSEQSEKLLDDLSNAKEDPTEALARSKGWVPPGEFQEDGKEALSAKEFLAREPLFEKIRELKAIQRQELHRLEKKIQESEAKGYKKALEDIAAKRKEAVAYGDIDKFNELDTEYNRLKEDYQQIQKVPESVSPPPVSEVANLFVERNKDWFNDLTPSNRQMVQQAIAIEQSLVESKPYLTEDQRLGIVEQEIKSLYKDRFVNTRKQAPAKVESAASDVKEVRGKPKLSDLTESQRWLVEQYLSADPKADVDRLISKFIG